MQSSDRIYDIYGKVVASHAEVARSIPGRVETAPIYNNNNNNNFIETSLQGTIGK